MTQTALPDTQDRPWKPAVLNGLRLKCPKCGKGALLHHYLKVNDTCAHCGQELFHQQADDGPAYLTIILVGHILGVAMHILYSHFKPDPLEFALALSSVAVVSSLILLPRMKGLMIAYQWSKRLHGF